VVRKEAVVVVVREEDVAKPRNEGLAMRPEMRRYAGGGEACGGWKSSNKSDALG